MLFPYIDEHKIDTIVHLGDVVDRRKYINYLTARRLHEDLMLPMFERNMDIHVLIGNHDVAYKDTNELNSMRELYGNSKHQLSIYERPTEVNLKGLDTVMMPWICADTYDDSIEIIAKTKAQVLFGHLELGGFEVYKGHVEEHGMDKDLFAKFDSVMSGHYHHKSDHGNIHYLGATAQHTWSDFDDKRGFHVLDTETRELEFIENPFEIFQKFVYDDQGKTHEELLDFDAVPFNQSYTKVIVKNKTDPFLFDRVIAKIETAGSHDLQVVEDHLNLDSMDDDDLIDEAQDTITILKKYVSGIDTNVPKKKIEKVIQDLYAEALNTE